MSLQFSKKQPCQNCPYRRGAPLAYWSAEEFKKLLASEKEYMGTVWGCHKNDGSVCVGWLMNQDERRFPSIALRIKLSKDGITRTYLDSLHCKSPRFAAVEEMCKANFPNDF